MDPVTSMGGDARRFPNTEWSQLMAADDVEQRRLRLAKLAEAYWKPVYHYIRRKAGCSSEQAKDLSQQFFTSLLDRDSLARFDPRAGRLRTFLKSALDRTLIDDLRRRTAARRGGGVAPVALEGDAGQLPAVLVDPGEAFDRAWVRDLLDAAVAGLERELAEVGLQRTFELFRAHDLDAPESGSRPTYGELARAFDLPLQTVKSQIDRARRTLRRLVQARIRTTCETEADAAAELLELFS